MCARLKTQFGVRAAPERPSFADRPDCSKLARSNRAHLALVLSGGGARAAYQVGCLRFLATHFPDFSPDILTGVSAGGDQRRLFGGPYRHVS